MRGLLLCLMLLAASAALAAPTTRYVSDDLGLPMRSGKGLQHKILKLVPSGTPVEVLEESPEDGYSLIRTPEGAEGWVITRYLMEQPGAKDQLARAQRRLERLETENKHHREEIAALSGRLEQSSARVQVLEGENAKMSADLDRLRAVAAEPIRLAEDNTRLESELREARERLAVLEAENETLSSRSLKEWFALGAAVSIGSLVLGLIISRLPRRRDSWDFH